MRSTGNKLLEELPESDYVRLAPHLQQIPLQRGEVIAEADDHGLFVFFPVDGVLSLVGVTENGATVEVADIGREGVANICALLGGSWLPFRMIAKIGGHALRLPTDIVAPHLRECGDFHERVMSCANAVIAQISQAAVCNRYHNATQRLARWILVTAERAGTHSLPLTHEFISSMIGGPRSAVTEASAELRGAGAIEYSRGMLRIASLDKLQAASCECYLAVRETLALQDAETKAH